MLVPSWLLVRASRTERFGCPLVWVGTPLNLASGLCSRQVGDRVYVAGAITGTYAERTLCAAANAHPLPETVVRVLLCVCVVRRWLTLRCSLSFQSFAAGAAIGVPA